MLEHVPGAAVAVEEHGVGYRVNRLFPPGELDGEMIICELDEMISTEVSRVIIRDPDSTSEDFVNLARKLGLHGTNYFIGWTAWLDLAPEGVSKASGLEWVCRDLGRRRRRRARHRRRPQRHRDAAPGPRAGWRWVRGPRSSGGRRPRHRTGRRRTALHSSCAAGGRERLPDVVTTARLRLELISPDEAAAHARRAARAELASRLPPPGRSRRRLDDPAADAGVGADQLAGRRATWSGPSTAWWSGRSDSSARRPRSPTASLEAEIGYGLVEDARGHGAATEAVARHAGAHRPARRTRAGECRAEQHGRACGCWRSAASPSCAVRTRRATW